MPKAASPSIVPPLESWAIGLVVLGVLVCAWAWLFRMGAASDIAICRVEAIASPAVIGMWIAMMVAMMTPSALPTILAYAQMTSRTEPSSTRLGLVALFASVYLAVWSAFGVMAAGADWLLVRDGIVRDGQFVSPLYAGGLLIVAGVYQWSAVKTVCLAHCHAPLGFLRRGCRGGYAGALTLGLEHSVFCVGCYWALMLLAWVGGAMNLAWMVVLTLFVSIENLLGTRPAVLRLSALVLLGAGVVQMVNSVL